MNQNEPSHGEIWLLNLSPTIGHEQSGIRPALIISTNQFNYGSAGLLVVLPLTTRYRGLPLHVSIEPPEGGIRNHSFIKCEDIRSVSKERLIERWGVVTEATMSTVDDRVRILLEL